MAMHYGPAGRVLAVGGRPLPPAPDERRNVEQRGALRYTAPFAGLLAVEGRPVEPSEDLQRFAERRKAATPRRAQPTPPIPPRPRVPILDGPPGWPARPVVDLTPIA